MRDGNLTAASCIALFGMFFLSFMIYMVGWSQGWRAHDKICPPHIAEVILQKN